MRIPSSIRQFWQRVTARWSPTPGGCLILRLRGGFALVMPESGAYVWIVYEFVGGLPTPLAIGVAERYRSRRAAKRAAMDYLFRRTR